MKFITPTLTALRNRNEIDIESCLRLYDSLMNAGIDGVAIFGSSGEFPHLPLSERRKLISAACRHINHRMQVLIGTGDMRAEEAIELANFAFSEGADAIMVVGPWYFALTDDDVLRHFGSIAAGVNGPVYIYNYPDRTGYSISPKVVLELGKTFPNIVGIKDTTPDMLHTVALIQTIKPELPNFEILSGFDYNFACNVLSGGDGCIAAISNIRPDLCVAWRDAMAAGDYAATARYQKIFNDIVAVYGMTSPFMSGVKSVLVDMGIFASDTMASPFTEASEEQKAAIRDFLGSF